MKTLKFFLKYFLFALISSKTNIKRIIRAQGFKIYSFDPFETQSTTAKLLKSCGCYEYAQSHSSFIYVKPDENEKIVFIREGLTEEDQLELLFHEEGHIWYDHPFYDGFTDNTSIQQEIQAQKFLSHLRWTKFYFYLSLIAIILSASLLLLRPLNTAEVADEEPQAVLQTAAYTIPKEDPIPADLLIAEASAEPTIEPATEPEAEPTGATVYITPSGKRYHRPDCYHIEGHSTISISKTEAENFSKTPCKTCKP